MIINPYVFGGSGGGGGGDTYRDLVVATVPNLVSYWPMDTQTGELEDQIGSDDLANFGSVTDDGDTYPGVEGGSRLLDGTDDDLQASTGLSENMLIGCLFKANTLPSGAYSLSGKWSSNNGMMLANRGSALAGFYEDPFIESGSILTTDTWYFAMFSSGDDGRRIYLDDAQVASSSDTFSHKLSGSSNWQVGAYSGNNGFFDGNIAHVWVASSQPGAASELSIAETLSLA